MVTKINENKDLKVREVTKKEKQQIANNENEKHQNIIKPATANIKPISDPHKLVLLSIYQSILYFENTDSHFTHSLTPVEKGITQNDINKHLLDTMMKQKHENTYICPYMYNNTPISWISVHKILSIQIRQKGMFDPVTYPDELKKYKQMLKSCFDKLNLNGKICYICLSIINGTTKQCTSCNCYYHMECLSDYNIFYLQYGNITKDEYDSHCPMCFTIFKDVISKPKIGNIMLYKKATSCQNHTLKCGITGPFNGSKEYIFEEVGKVTNPENLNKVTCYNCKQPLEFYEKILMSLYIKEAKLKWWMKNRNKYTNKCMHCFIVDHEKAVKYTCRDNIDGYATYHYGCKQCMKKLCTICSCDEELIDN